MTNEQIARALPNYLIGEELGRGSWGVVLRGEHRRLHRDVAIKQLPNALVADADVRHRFASEARMLASLNHPHIVDIFDYVEREDVCLLIMELLPGGTVRDRLATGVSVQAACGIVVDTCSALHYAHGKGILHRDVKPENLMFNADGALKVTDFGIAKLVGAGGSFATKAGAVLGTPAYIAPEQAVGGQELTAATDIYSTGVLLYELLAGQLPYPADDSVLAQLFRHVYEPPLPLLTIAPGIPPVVADVVMKALAADPTQRYPSADAFGNVLVDAANHAWGSGWRTVTTSRYQPTVVTPLPSGPWPSTAPPATIPEPFVAPPKPTSPLPSLDAPPPPPPNPAAEADSPGLFPPKGRRVTTVLAGVLSVFVLGAILTWHPWVSNISKTSPTTTPGGANTTTPKVTTVGTSSPASVTTTTIQCTNGTNPACGRFHYAPAPDNKSMTVTVTYLPHHPVVGQEVTFTVVIDDPDDATDLRITGTYFGDTPPVAASALSAPCPLPPTGAWTLPGPGPKGHFEPQKTHIYGRSGVFHADFTAASGALPDPCKPDDPYASTGDSGTVEVTIARPPPPPATTTSTSSTTTTSSVPTT